MNTVIYGNGTGKKCDLQDSVPGSHGPGNKAKIRPKCINSSQIWTLHNGCASRGGVGGGGVWDL